MRIPSIHIIILNWNGLSDTVRCINSLKESDLSGTTIYVIDNGSANNEAEQLAQMFPGITVFPQGENTGFCKGNNIGIQKAVENGAELILLLNSDTIIPKDAINILAQEFINTPHAGAMSPVILQYPETDYAGFVEARWHAEKAQFVLNPNKKRYDEIKNTQPWRSEFANGCCLLTSSKVVKIVGLLDERYFAYYDEADWCKRLEKFGYYSYVTPASVIYHVKYSLLHSRVSMYLLTRNRLLWMKENLSFRQRSKSFLYLGKEVLWHFLNLLDLVNGIYAKDISRAYLMGWKDYLLSHFGRWDNKHQRFLLGK
jgi:hypothetical protein